MIKVLITLLVLILGLGVIWYNGGLADFYASYPDRTPRITTAPNYDPIVIAHRGDSHAAPENTLAAIRAAIANELDYVEIDIRATADGVPVVMHDVDVDRTTDGEGDLSSYSFAELRKLDAGSWFAAEFVGTRVPTLEEALDEARGKICLLADVKSTPNRQVVRQLKSFGEQEGKYCLLVNLRQTTKEEAYPDADIPAEMRKKLAERIELNNKAAEKTYMIFRRYWPEFPLTRALRTYESPKEVADMYPSLIGLEINGPSLSEARVRQAHQLGLFTYFRAEAKGLDTEQRFRHGLTAGIDAFFISQVDSFRDFVRRFQQEGGS